jgi:hypothetical protein
VATLTPKRKARAVVRHHPAWFPSDPCTPVEADVDLNRLPPETKRELGDILFRKAVGHLPKHGDKP